MIITALNSYYEHLFEKDEVLPHGFSKEKISYAILLSKDGKVVDVHDVRDTSGKKPQPIYLPVPQPPKRAAGIEACLFWDKTSYALGVTAKEDDKALKRLPLVHAAFKKKMLTVLADTRDEGLVALRCFLQNWSPEDFNELPHASEEMLDSNVVFKLDGENAYLHERPAARDLCVALAQEKGYDAYRGMCLVTGKKAPLARLHPSIKGVRGAQSSGANIVSFNLASFTSFGKEQSYNAPIAAQVADQYIKALNYLLRKENRRSLIIGDATTVFWAIADDSKAAEKAEGLLHLCLNPSTDEQEAGKLRLALDKVAKGRPLQAIDPELDENTKIYVLGLSPNASRLSVRFWETGNLDFFVKKISQHYQDLHLKPLPWQTPPSIWRLLLETTPSRNNKHDSKDILPHLAGEMMRAIISGGNYPLSLLSSVVMRMRSDGDISGLRVALCKAVITRFYRNSSNKEAVPVSLDTSVTNQGYLLGRWFAELEGAQRGALGKDVNATIRDQYYGSASSNPATTFPTLIRKYQNHISKVSKEKKGLAINIEKKIGEIVDKLPDKLPDTLSLEDQGRFSIGYYHQRQEQFKKKDSSED